MLPLLLPLSSAKDGGSGGADGAGTPLAPAAGEGGPAVPEGDPLPARPDPRPRAFPPPRRGVGGAESSLGAGGANWRCHLLANAICNDAVMPYPTPRFLFKDVCKEMNAACNHEHPIIIVKHIIKKQWV